MYVPETLIIASDALRRNKLRSFLTLLGVIIGIMTIVAVVSVISGLNSYITTQVFQLNPDIFIATQFGIITNFDDFLEALKRKRIDRDDVEAIARLCSSCKDVGASSQTRQTARYRAERLDGVQVSGVSANMAELNNLDLEEGRFFTPTEDHHSAPVAIIGWDVKDELFGRLDPIGREIRVGAKPMTVIGTLRKQGSVLGQNQDSVMYIPLKTAEKAFGSRRSLAIFVRPHGGIPAMGESQDEVRVILRARRATPFNANDPFSFVTAEALQNVWKSISANAFALMVFISGISLGVGGIVIMNIMLVSVVERTKEIGIRRAIGAKRRDIQLQFLTEAVLLSAIGGASGVFLGWLISKGISNAFPLPTLVRPSLVVTGLVVSVVTGVAAGLFPAIKAAKLPPVEALRYE